MFSLIRERWEKGRRQRGLDINQLPPLCALPRDQTCKVDMGPELKFNLQPFGVSKDIKPTEPGLV